MTTPRFFGYGSLVNKKTHANPNFAPATVTGWKRVWQPTAERDVAFLSVHPVASSTIRGVTAVVPNNDWAQLDKREYGYARSVLERSSLDPADQNANIQIYAVANPLPLTEENYIFLSYLDVVVQGFLNEFGKAGPEDFFDTTDGWDVRIIDDRHAPRYPRHQVLNDAERSVVDSNLRNLSAVVEKLEDAAVKSAML